MFQSCDFSRLRHISNIAFYALIPRVANCLLRYFLVCSISQLDCTLFCRFYRVCYYFTLFSANFRYLPFCNLYYLFILFSVNFIFDDYHARSLIFALSLVLYARLLIIFCRYRLRYSAEVFQPTTVLNVLFTCGASPVLLSP